MEKTLQECTKEGCVYKYEINHDDGSMVGIVIAESRVEAKNKVKDAYMKHGYSNSELDSIVVMNAKSGWFSDAPDVLEIFWN